MPTQFTQLKDCKKDPEHDSKCIGVPSQGKNQTPSNQNCKHENWNAHDLPKALLQQHAQPGGAPGEQSIRHPLEPLSGNDDSQSLYSNKPTHILFFLSPHFLHVPHMPLNLIGIGPDLPAPHDLTYLFPPTTSHWPLAPRLELLPRPNLVLDPNR